VQPESVYLFSNRSGSLVHDLDVLRGNIACIHYKEARHEQEDNYSGVAAGRGYCRWHYDPAKRCCT
jgi:hypothetical protein